MADNLRIRRDRSALSDGTIFGRRRRGFARWKLGLWVLAMLFMGLIVSQFGKVQPTVLAWVGTAATPTPSNVTYADRGYKAYLTGNLELAIDNYCYAAHGVPGKPYANPRCATPDPGSPSVIQADVSIVYELVRVLVYRNYDDRRLSIYDQNAEDWGNIVAEANPNNSRAHAIYTFALTNNYKSEQAISDGLTAVRLNPKDGEAHAYLSMAYYDSKRFASAVDEGEQAVALDEQSVDSHIALANALFVTNQKDGALAEFQTATKINPFLQFPYFYLASFYLNQQRTEEAIATYGQVLAIDNKSVKALTRKCAAYLNEGSTTEALADCKTATTLDPSFTEAWKWQGQVLYNRRDYEDAITALETCKAQEEDAVAKGQIKASARQPECWYLLGLTYYTLDNGRNGYCGKAYKLFNEVLSFSSNSQAIRLTRAGIAGCAQSDPSYPTPTPIPPTPTLRPAIPLS